MNYIKIKSFLCLLLLSTGLTAQDNFAVIKDIDGFVSVSNGDLQSK